MAITVVEVVRRLRAEATEQMRRASETQGMARRVHTANAQLLRLLADEFESELSD